MLSKKEQTTTADPLHRELPSPCALPCSRRRPQRPRPMALDARKLLPALWHRPMTFHRSPRPMLVTSFEGSNTPRRTRRARSIQTTHRFMPSFSLVTLKLISKPMDRSSNSILRALRVLRGDPLRPPSFPSGWRFADQLSCFNAFKISVSSLRRRFRANGVTTESTENHRVSVYPERSQSGPTRLRTCAGRSSSNSPAARFDKCRQPIA